jgi:hypothetical protein
VNNHPNSLAQRRAELVELCAQQRVWLSEEVAAFRSPLGGAGLAGMLGAKKPVVLAVAGVAIGLLVTRPKRLLSALAGFISTIILKTVIPSIAGNDSPRRRAPIDHMGRRTAFNCPVNASSAWVPAFAGMTF